MKNYMFGDASFWQSTYTLSAIKLLVDNGMKAIVLRGGYAETEDSLLETLVGYCRTLKIPFALYWYLYPSVDYKKQINKFISVINKYPDAKSAVLDFEEYQMPAYTIKQGIPNPNENKLGYNYERVMDSIAGRGLGLDPSLKLTANYSSAVLSVFYKNSYDFLKAQMPNMKVWVYSAQWSIDAYFPQVSSWVKPEFYWNAAYVKYTAWYKNLITSLGGSWGDSTKLISISNLPAIMAEVEKHWNEQPFPVGMSDCIAWQFGSFFPFSELTRGQRNIDMNLAPASTFKEYFNLELEGGEPLPPEIGKKLEVPFVSQLGDGAGLYNNDCGEACCSMVLMATKDIYVQPDQWLQMDGWNPPNTDIGTTAYQLQKALSLFDVRTQVGSSLTIDSMRKNIDLGLPIIILVKYGTLSNAGLTYSKGSFNHWLVVIGYDNNNILTLDPYRPYTQGGLMIVPNQILINSYLNSYLLSLDSTEGGAIPMATNGKVTNASSLNVRETPPVNGVSGNRIGGLNGGQEVTVIREQDGWYQISTPIGGWVSKMYITLFAPIIPVEQPSLDERAIRLDEILKIESLIAKRKLEI